MCSSYQPLVHRGVLVPAQVVVFGEALNHLPQRPKGLPRCPKTCQAGAAPWVGKGGQGSGGRRGEGLKGGESLAYAAEPPPHLLQLSAREVQRIDAASACLPACPPAHPPTHLPLQAYSYINKQFGDNGFEIPREPSG